MDICIDNNSTKILTMFFEDFRNEECLGHSPHKSELVAQQKHLLY